MPQHLDPLNPAMIAAEIARLVELLEERTEEYGQLIREAAEADVGLKRSYAEAMLQVISDGGASRRVTVAEREARVEVMITEDREVAAIKDAAAKSGKESLLSLRHQIDALRSLGANVRVQT